MYIYIYMYVPLSVSISVAVDTFYVFVCMISERSRDLRLMIAGIPMCIVSAGIIIGLLPCPLPVPPFFLSMTQ